MEVLNHLVIEIIYLQNVREKKMENLVVEIVVIAILQVETILHV